MLYNRVRRFLPQFVYISHIAAHVEIHESHQIEESESSFGEIQNEDTEQRQPDIENRHLFFPVLPASLAHQRHVYDKSELDNLFHLGRDYT